MSQRSQKPDGEADNDNEPEEPIDEEKLREDIMEFDRYLELMFQATADDDVENDVELGEDGEKSPTAADRRPSDAVSAAAASDDRRKLNGSGAGDGETGIGETQTKKQREPGGGGGCHANCRQFFGRVFTLVKTDLGLLLLLLIYSVLGAALLHMTESGVEHKLKADLDRTRGRVVVDILRLTSNQSSAATAGRLARNTAGQVSSGQLAKEVEQLVVEYASAKDNLWPYTTSPGWSYTGAFYFCATIFTTVGYGNVYPLTDTGRIITIVYAAFGIPLCLVLLANLGKTMTRLIKHLWSFVRRFYYTGSFRRRRHTMVPLSRLRMTLCQRIRLHFRRRTWHRQALRSRGQGHRNAHAEAEMARMKKMEEICVPYEVDDNFNLPPIVALTIAFLYMIIGAFIYSSWENWTYTHAFYFTFISLSTIGLGDIVPEHPRYFLATGFYLLLGLALIAMVINVFMVAVHSTINKATDHVKTALAEAPQIVRRIHRHQEAAAPLSSTPQPRDSYFGSSTRRRSV